MKMKKSICNVCLLLLIMSKCFSLDYYREKSVSYRGTEELSVTAWGSMLVFLFPITCEDTHDFNWEVTLSPDNDRKLCSSDSEDVLNKESCFNVTGCW